ncbi:hypothetical protein PV08_07844 [Exophiala spinifera]|uniref:Vacuolar protein sorting-associated protein 51 homolog n=1 Tax=Exophiala spinifera TaxID=91928 RepID=A0A0D1ZQK7_9EURO|nr:uncharacterized protein PV08_07844 [Exophiala spinifera]KIW15057.1 hypothetical protein PV08_07844 [Exophiala spinifera]
MATITSPRSESPAITIPRITSPSISSTNGTPMSSVRPSFDIPRTPTKGPASPSLHAPLPLSNPAQRRNRAALRDYYNLNKTRGTSGADHSLDLSRKTSTASTASESTITSTSAVPPEPSASLTAQLDDNAFDAEAYVADLLKTASLRDILRTESSLVSEIRTLDGERKALVYDNYSKLIRAVGTIAEMQKGMHKTGQPSMPSVVRGVVVQKDTRPSLDGVDKLGEKLDGLLRIVEDLGPPVRREEDLALLVDAREKRRQKETVQWALDAPRRLQAMLDKAQIREAESEYESVKRLLEQWTDVRGVAELQEKCAQVMPRTHAPDDDSAAASQPPHGSRPD